MAGPAGEYWQLILSGQGRKRALKTLERKIKKEYKSKAKALKALGKTLFACDKDAVAAAKALAEKLKFHKLSDQTIEAKMGYEKAGRPPSGAEKKRLGHKIKATLVRNRPAIKQAKIPCGRFILATNQQGMSALEMLETYKEQDSVERGFLFIKDKSFQCNRIY